MSHEAIGANYDEVVAHSEQLYQETAQGVRRVGMISEQRLEESLHDPRTITGTTEDGGRVVLFTPIEYGDGAGYDARRCVDDILPDNGTEQNTLVYLSGGGLLEKLTEDSRQEVAGRLAAMDNGYIFFSVGEHDNPLNSAQAELRSLFQEVGLHAADIPLIDTEVDESHKFASLSLYGVDVPREVSPENTQIVWDDIYKAYERGVAEGRYVPDRENGYDFMRGSDISDELADQMWDVYTERFQWLGNQHPISMEDTKEDFMQVFRSDKTNVSVRFKDGKPICFTDIVGDTSELYWLNQDFLQNSPRMQRDPRQFLIFFPGIVAGEQGANYSLDVISLATNVAMDTGSAIKVIFENTNRSETYIPRIVRDCIQSTGRAEVAMPAVIDKTDYLCTGFAKLSPGEQ